MINSTPPIYTKRFCPKKAANMVMLPRIKRTLLDENGEPKILNHLILSGSPGLGKTTFLDIVASMYPTLKVNASFYSSVDDLKTEISDFCKTATGVFDDTYQRREFKVVYLDELDGVSKQYQDALKGFIETYEDRVRFVATCNNPNKISDALLDERYVVVNFNPLNEEERKYLMSGYAKRLEAIASKVEASDKVIEYIPTIVKKCFPSMRRCLKKLEFVVANGIDSDNMTDIGSRESEMLRIMTGNASTEQTWNCIIESWLESPESLALFCGKTLPEWIFANNKELAYCIPDALDASVNCQKELASEAIDPLVSMANMVLKIKNKINRK